MKSGYERKWIMPTVLVLGLTALFIMAIKSAEPVSADAPMQASTEGGILVVPVQLERDSYGVAMVDTLSQTMWVYQLSSHGPAYNRLKLFAARSFRYDRMLQQYNTAEPKPQQVRIMLESLGQEQTEQSEQKQPDEGIEGLEAAEPNEPATVR